MCDCCLKELSDTLTSLYSAAALLYSANFIFCPPLSPLRCFLSSVALMKCREPRRKLSFPIPDSYCGQGGAPCPRTRTPQIWSLTSEALSRWSCGVNHRVSPVERFKVFIASFTLFVWNINHLHGTSINVSAFEYIWSLREASQKLQVTFKCPWFWERMQLHRLKRH